MDRITSAFAVRSFSDRRAAFAELHRVLMPGGRGVILEFSPPANGFLDSIATGYVRIVIPFIGGVVSGDRDAYRYLSQTIMAFPSPDGIAAELKAVGFSGIASQRLTGGVTVLYTFDRPDA